jgi:drug/metabolite transporter (DMT)-like permease
MSSSPPAAAPRRVRLLAEAGLVYAAAIWGSTFFIVKGALDHIHPVALVGWRFSIAALLLGLWITLRAPRGRRLATLLHGWRGGLSLGLILLVLYLAQTIGLEWTTASNSGFITGLFIVFTPLLAWLLFKRRARPRQLLAVAVALCGLWLLCGGVGLWRGGVNPGDAITLLAAVTYALHVLYGGRYMAQGLDPLALSFQQSALIGGVSLLLAGGLGLYAALTPQALGSPAAAGASAALAHYAGSGGWHSLGVVLFLALFPTLSAFVIQLWAQRSIDPVRTTLIFTLEPVFAALFAWTLGGEPLLPLKALGGALILAAMLLSESGASL